MKELEDKEYRRAFLREAIIDMLTGELDSAKMVLREYINGTVGFVRAGEDLGRSPKSLLRMLSKDGNPHARNLLELIAYLQKADGVVVEIVLGDAVAA
jgi:DNA-binding phage protein